MWLLNFLGHFWVHHAWLPIWLLKIFSKLIHRQVHISYCFLFESLKILFFVGVKPVFKTAYDLCGKQEKVLDPGDFHQIYTTFIQWVLIVLI